MSGRHRGWSPSYVIVSVDDATAATGLTVDELLALPGMQQLVRVDHDGARTDALRLPAELVPNG